MLQGLWPLRLTRTRVSKGGHGQRGGGGARVSKGGLSFSVGLRGIPPDISVL